MYESDPYSVNSFQQCPVPDAQRKRTDIFCTICTGLFALILFIVACATFNNYNLKKMTYFTDGVGQVCAFQLEKFPIAYFTSPTDPSKRLCVAECPKAGDKELKCNPTEKLACGANNNPDYEVQIYDSEYVNNRIGLVCMPTDPDLFKQISQISGMTSKYYFLTIYDSIWTSLWISIVFGIILIALLQFMSRKVVNWMFILGACTFIALGIVLFIVPHGFILFKIIGGIVFLFMGFIVAASFLYQPFRAEIFICGRLFEIAAQIVRQYPLVLVYILIWWILQVGLIALISFQMLSAWSIGPLYFFPDHPFYEVGSFISNFLSFWVFVEFIWGLSFLKQAFNFCVGGFATLWYCYRDNDRQKIKVFHSLTLLLKYHWGSVAGGSLLLVLFYFVDLFTDFFCSDDNRVAADKQRIEPLPFERRQKPRRGCRSFFDLIRSQSFAYINLIPIPYCNASRYCQMFAEESSFYDRSQVTNRLFRLSAHIVIMMIATLIALAANRHTEYPANVVGVFFVAIVSLFSVTYFIGLHGDLAEGILVSVFVEQKLNFMNGAVRMSNKHVRSGDLIRPPPIVQALYRDDTEFDIYENTNMIDYVRGHANDQVTKSAKNPQVLQSIMKSVIREDPQSQYPSSR